MKWKLSLQNPKSLSWSQPGSSQMFHLINPGPRTSMDPHCCGDISPGITTALLHGNPKNQSCWRCSEHPRVLYLNTAAKLQLWGQTKGQTNPQSPSPCPESSGNRVTPPDRAKRASLGLPELLHHKMWRKLLKVWLNCNKFKIKNLTRTQL